MSGANTETLVEATPKPKLRNAFLLLHSEVHVAVADGFAPVLLGISTSGLVADADVW